MMTFVFEQEDGTLGLTSVDFDSLQPDVSCGQLLANLEAGVKPGCRFRLVESNELPSATDFLQAWRFEVTPAKKTAIKGNRAKGIKARVETTPEKVAIVVDMAEAKKLHLSRLRAARNLKLVALDSTYVRALEAGPEVAKKVSAQKQVLRDLPAAVQEQLDNIKTIEELRQFVPDCLKA